VPGGGELNEGMTVNRYRDGLRPDDRREAVRIVAGIMIALGLALVAFRRGTSALFEETTSNFGLFVILGVAAGFLYGVGIAGRKLGGYDRRWQTLYTVTGMLLMPIALFYLAAAIDSGYDETLVAIFVFGACTVGCLAAWLIASVRFQLLLGALYAAFTWLALLDKVLSDGLDSDLSTVRALLLVFAVGLVFAALAIRKRASAEPEASFGELLTGAGLTALIAFALGPAEAIDALDQVVVATALGVEEELGVADPSQEMVWDVLTLITGTALVLFGIGRGLRGQVYVGGAMLILFLVSVGLDLDDITPEGAIVGWPLLLCVLGAGAFLLSLLPGDRLPAAFGLGTWFHGGRDPLDDDAARAAPVAAPAAAPAPAEQSHASEAPPSEEPPTQAQPPSEAGTESHPTEQPPTQGLPPSPTDEPPTQRLPPSPPEEPPPSPGRGDPPPR